MALHAQKPPPVCFFHCDISQIFESYVSFYGFGNEVILLAIRCYSTYSKWYRLSPWTFRADILFPLITMPCSLTLPSDGFDGLKRTWQAIDLDIIASWLKIGPSHAHWGWWKLRISCCALRIFVADSLSATCCLLLCEVEGGGVLVAHHPTATCGNTAECPPKPSSKDSRACGYP